MRLHVLAGCRDLLQPEVLTPEVTADLIGPHARVATAFWLSPKCGNRYHGFLQGAPGDRRTEVMAAALKDEFGTRFEPLLVLVDLLDEIKPSGQHVRAAALDQRSQFTVLSEILATGHVRQLQLHGLALPSKAHSEGSWARTAGIITDTVYDRIERLREAITAGTAFDAVETQVIEATPDLPAFNTLYNNSLCTQFAFRLTPRLLQRGWTPDVEGLGLAISRILSDWNSKGVFLSRALRTDHLEGMTDLICERLLQR